MVWLVGKLVCLVCWLVVGLVGCRFVWFGWLLVCFVCLSGWLVSLFVGWLVVGLVFRFGWLVKWLVGCWFDFLLF